MTEMINYLSDFFTNEDGVEVAKIVVTLSGATIAAIISLIVSLSNNRRIKKNVYINTITSNRIEWSNKLKVLVNDYIKYSNVGKGARIHNDDEYGTQEFFEYLLTKKNSLILHLNYRGQLDEMIIEKVNEVYDLLEMLYTMIDYFEDDEEGKEIEFLKTNMPDNEKLMSNLLSGEGIPSNLAKLEFNSLLLHIVQGLHSMITERHNDLLRIVQVYTKLEWNRVKKEANGRVWSTPTFYSDYKARKALDRNKSVHINNSFDKLKDYISKLNKEDYELEFVINIRGSEEPRE